MAGRPWDSGSIAVVVRDYPAGRDIAEIAEELDRSEAAVRLQARKMGLLWGSKPKGKGFTTEKPATVNRSPEEVIADQARHFEEKRARWDAKHNGIKITLDEPGPYGVLFFGDPHADDDGFDFPKFSYDLRLVKETPHLFAANMGDLTNNWIGRLGHLWGVQHVTTDEAIGIADWIINEIPWLFVILGNHDKWSHDAEILCKKAGVTHVSHGAVFNVYCGDDRTRIDARHTHKGNSMYNPSHAQLKKNFRGSDCDVIIGAHIHSSAYTMVKNGVTGKIGHCVRVGTYKRYDEFPDMLGLEDECISPSVMAVIDPRRQDTGKVTMFHDSGQGAEYLTFLRSLYGKEAAPA